MSIPALLFSLLLASVYGLAFYILFGRGWLMLGLYWVVAVAGFFVGQLVSRIIGLTLIPIGSVNVVEASVLSIIALLAARTLYKR
jgi:hypothetical protein